MKQPMESYHIDRYEFTNLQAAIESGVAKKPAVFEAFTRYVPKGALRPRDFGVGDLASERFGVVAGIERLVAAVYHMGFRFDMRPLAFLDPATQDFLRNYTFRGTLRAYRDGDFYLTGSPVVQVEGTFADCVLLETIILSILNHDCAIATQASKLAQIANPRPLIDMATRRTHDAAAVDVARAAYLGGFVGTSNMEAGRQFDIPTIGTAAHCLILAHDTELDAFRAQARTMGWNTTYLIDTYDVEQGTRYAVAACLEVTGHFPAAVRIDSGDKLVVAKRVRTILDEAGATQTRITASGEIGERELYRLREAPIDSYGIGTVLTRDAASPGFVYKLVQIGDRAVEKRSPGKVSKGGRKMVARDWEDDCNECQRVIGQRPVDLISTEQQPHGEPVLVEYITKGILNREALPTPNESRRFHLEQVRRLTTPAVKEEIA